MMDDGARSLSRGRSASAQAAAEAGQHAAALSREDLAEAVRNREPEVLRAVVETYLPQILRAARGAGLGPEEAEEVTQETFTTFLQIAPRFEGRSRVRTFLFGILYRKISEARRERSAALRRDSIDDVMESRFDADGSWARPPARTDLRAHRGELRRALAECLQESPAAQRMAFFLREVQGLERREICQILAVTSSNLDVMLYRLRNRTRECLEARQVAPHRDQPREPVSGR
jgi:RNA polymerase sigma-70 factor, ECF subfamily